MVATDGARFSLQGKFSRRGRMGAPGTTKSSGAKGKARARQTGVPRDCRGGTPAPGHSTGRLLPGFLSGTPRLRRCDAATALAAASAGQSRRPAARCPRMDAAKRQVSHRPTEGFGHVARAQRCALRPRCGSPHRPRGPAALSPERKGPHCAAGAASPSTSGISRATMNAKASSARRAAVKIAVRSLRNTCSQASM